MNADPWERVRRLAVIERGLMDAKTAVIEAARSMMRTRNELNCIRGFDLMQLEADDTSLENAVKALEALYAEQHKLFEEAARECGEVTA